MSKLNYLASQGVRVNATFAPNVIPLSTARMASALRGLTDLGAFDTRVWQAQTYLKQVWKAGISADGIMGPATQAALAKVGLDLNTAVGRAAAIGIVAPVRTQPTNAQERPTGAPATPPGSGPTMVGAVSPWDKAKAFYEAHKVPVLAAGGAVALLVLLKLTGRKTTAAVVVAPAVAGLDGAKHKVKITRHPGTGYEIKCSACGWTKRRKTKREAEQVAKQMRQTTCGE